MILYFTGTGNSKFVAEYIADHISDECVSLNDILKFKRPLKFKSARPFVVVAPIYAWGFPKIIEKLISNAEFTGNYQIYFIATMGSQTGEAEKQLEDIAEKKGMECFGFCGVAMPNNYIRGGNLPTAEEADSQIKSALPLLADISERIKSGKIIRKCDTTPLSSVMSGTVNKMFNKYFISSSSFKVSEKCIGCGLCANVCPVNNIRLLPDNTPYFDNYCLNCYACINKCPSRAINIGKRTENYNRYVCPEYSEWKKRGMID